MPALELRAEPGVKWAHRFCFLLAGAPTCVCALSLLWILLLSAAFALAVSPGVAKTHGSEILLLPFALFALVLVAFCLVSCHDPGIAQRPPSGPDGPRHPGEEYTFSKDSKRYVRGFDHFCELVGNDIGAGNMPYFILLLLSLTALASTLFLLCTRYTYEITFPPGEELHWRVRENLLPLLLIFSIIGSCLSSYSRSAVCAELVPLILMMPGARIGFTCLALCAMVATLLLVCTDIWEDVSLEHNPVAIFLLVPYLAFAILFFGMSAHWSWLICEGMSQKIWLRSQGWTRRRVPDAGIIDDPSLDLV